MYTDSRPFDHDDYLSLVRPARPAPAHLFEPFSRHRKHCRFRQGHRLEAADVVETEFFSPSTVRTVAARRLLRVNLDGWHKAYDVWLDYRYGVRRFYFANTPSMRATQLA